MKFPTYTRKGLSVLLHKKLNEVNKDKAYISSIIDELKERNNVDKKEYSDDHYFQLLNDNINYKQLAEVYTNNSDSRYGSRNDLSYNLERLVKAVFYYTAESPESDSPFTLQEKDKIRVIREINNGNVKYHMELVAFSANTDYKPYDPYSDGYTNNRYRRLPNYGYEYNDIVSREAIFEQQRLNMIRLIDNPLDGWE